MGGIDLSEWGTSERRGEVDGLACRLLERAQGPTVMEYLWLADDDFRVLRHEQMRQGRTLTQLTVMYATEQASGVVPAGWTILQASYPSEATLQTSVFQVRDFKLNSPVPRSRFEFEFPAGIIVTDEVSSQRSIVRADGSLRPVTAGELAADIPFEDLMRTDPPPEAGASANGNSRRLIAYLCGAVLAGAAAALWWRRRRGLG
jgi:hypothetical protein